MDLSYYDSRPTDRGPSPSFPDARMGLPSFLGLLEPLTSLSPSYPYLPSRSQSYTSTLMVLENKQQRILGRMDPRTGLLLPDQEGCVQTLLHVPSLCAEKVHLKTFQQRS